MPVTREAEHGEKSGRGTVARAGVRSRREAHVRLNLGVKLLDLGETRRVVGEVALLNG